MGEFSFCSDVSYLIFPFHSQKKSCICHYNVCPFAEEFAAGERIPLPPPNNKLLHGEVPEWTIGAAC